MRPGIEPLANILPYVWSAWNTKLAGSKGKGRWEYINIPVDQMMFNKQQLDSKIKTYSAVSDLKKVLIILYLF